VIPPDYAAQVRAGKSAQVLAVVDASDATSARVVLSVSAAVGNSLSRELSVQLLERQGVRVSPPPIEVRTRAWYNPNLRSEVFILPGVLALILQFTTTFLSITLIVREREIGTLEQLVVTPIQPVELMLGKVLPLVALGYINITFILLLSWVWFGVAVKGSLLLLYAVVLAFFFSSLGIGTLISTVSRTFQQAAQLAQLVSLPIALQYAGLALPLTHFVIVVRGIIIKGVGITFLWREILLLMGLGIVVFILAISRFQKKID
jgi:ABC-2 type transport system permease protein